MVLPRLSSDTAVGPHPQLLGLQRCQAAALGAGDGEHHLHAARAVLQPVALQPQPAACAACARALSARTWC